MVCLQFMCPTIPHSISRLAGQRYVSVTRFDFMNAKLFRIEGQAANKVAEVIGKVNIVLQHQAVFSIRLRDQAPSIGVAQKATDLGVAEMRPAWIRPVRVLPCAKLCSVHCGNTRIFKFLSSELPMHPVKSLNILV